MAKGDWDNLNERGKRDRIWLARTEYWELDYFIDHYIQLRNYEKSDKSREIVRKAINGYTGQTPIKREDMEAYLNKLWPKKS